MKCRHVSVPEGGSQPSWMAKTTIRMRPNQKLGIAWPATEMNRATRSMIELGRIAATTPKGTAVSSAKVIPQTPSVMVTLNRSAMSEATGRRK